LTDVFPFFAPLALKIPKIKNKHEEAIAFHKKTKLQKSRI
jgi:hypothetical protein